MWQKVDFSSCALEEGISASYDYSHCGKHGWDYLAWLSYVDPVFFLCMYSQRTVEAKYLLLSSPHLSFARERSLL